ncbi:hypothetical protein PISMIDRAFT_677869 [Pisolithus microcarpus 441]|uniref:Unplaced genomic scaffold scaffold_29, whole genome shotgun sequence n=1 Tax=Pisolithus microcarpus 441 TaxID=765257 RepID=A0A0C9ZYG0_9AGAM|nr:hypothetical protein PISMIDRAFT_677869 [Pisolithus microcarpus 441]
MERFGYSTKSIATFICPLAALYLVQRTRSFADSCKIINYGKYDRLMNGMPRRLQGLELGSFTSASV